MPSNLWRSAACEHPNELEQVIRRKICPLGHAYTVANEFDVGNRGKLKSRWWLFWLANELEREVFRKEGWGMEGKERQIDPTIVLVLV